MQELDELLSDVRERGHDVWLAGPASNDAIAKLADALGVSLPPSLVTFLRSWGALAIYDTSVSGILDDDPLDESAGSLYGDTVLLRSDMNLPPNFLVVGRHEDGAYCLDSMSVDSNGEWPVVNFEYGSDAARVSDTFKDWLVDFVLRGWANEDA